MEETRRGAGPDVSDARTAASGRTITSDEVAAWSAQAADALLAGGCREVRVVLGARAEEARALLPQDPAVSPLVAERWAEGVSASLTVGLEAAAGMPGVDAVVVTLVDLPALPAGAVRRVLGHDDDRRSSLRRAFYGALPGHPVLIGRRHWPPLQSALVGDHGAGAYLEAHGAEPVACGDLWDGRDRDRP